ncbi:unnamed protein product [Medioppia subpectinata]|uniref:Transmembrane protein n=1 Tax=Medioppia subpectinata TaxID=1979941 RepID=A0A7R9KEK8_9ACAR|nr:unnamed protein product [Medioppia subpectinata]CAG2100895.1 unnamed protein product [Medioppia subpectinata]
MSGQSERQWMPTMRSPFVSFNDMFNLVHEKGLKAGFYNSIALIFLLFVIIIIYMCYWILQPFVRPLVWAILCGSALHPFKRQLILYSRKWITDLRRENTPITLGTVCLPFCIINSTTDSMVRFLMKYMKQILVIGFVMLLHNYFFNAMDTICEYLYIWLLSTIEWLSVIMWFWTHDDYTFPITSITIAYFIVLMFDWSLSTQEYFIWLSPFVLLLFSVHIICLFGTYGHILSTIIISIILIGLTKTIITGHMSPHASDETDGFVSFSIKIKNKVISLIKLVNNLIVNQDNEELVVDNDDHPNGEHEPQTDDNSEGKEVAFSPKEPLNVDKSSNTRRTSCISIKTNNEYQSNTYLFAVLWAVVIVQMWSHSSLIYLLPIPIIMDFVETSLNGLTSLSVISVTIISILFIGVFMSIQTLSYYPESSQLLPESLKGVDGMLDEMVRNGYEYGRQYIKNSVRNALNVDSNVTQSKAVEKQILEIWDRAYHLWLIRNTNETDSLPKKGPYDFDKLYNALKTLDLNLCFNIVKENIDTVVSVFDSVWLLLKGNFTLLFSAIAAVFSTLLGGGLGLMNLVFSFIIFMTALFYLLSASGEYYKPVELVNQIFPSEVTPNDINNSTPNLSANSKLGRAVEEAVNGVFAASLKMSAFYGLYTWLIHTLFDASIVYIPSVMAAMFGAIPFISAFWASFPTFLDLFFVQNQTTKAILLLITAYFPAFFVDSTIYSEIKSAGHPYLTGLAIAGGLFYLGFEGAFFGPFLLCCLFVAFNIYKDIMQESSVTAVPSDRTPHSTRRPKDSHKLLRMKSSYLN